MAYDTDARASTSTGIKSDLISLNNHLNITNSMVSLMAPSASHDKKDATAMYMPKINIQLKCYTQATYAN